MNFLKTLKESKEKKCISEKIFTIFTHLYDSYKVTLETDGLVMENYEHNFLFLLQRVQEQLANPYQFESYHKKITIPIDYFNFAIDFIRPLVNLEKSVLLHEENISKIIKQLQANENVIFFANHQTEVDPQLINILLEKKASAFASEIIFVAGDRVLTDPMATPFSMGCNLLCIYSKRHIDNPPEKRVEKQLHNQHTMQILRKILMTGGNCIYVAPAGGRDRPNQDGEIEVAAFDPQSIEMFRLLALKAKTKTHFYPLALSTYDILPPPQDIEKDLGERRKTTRSRILIAFGDEIDLDAIGDEENEDRHALRQKRCDVIFKRVNEYYKKLKSL